MIYCCVLAIYHTLYKQTVKLHNVLSPPFPSAHRSQTLIISSTPYSRTPSTYVTPSISATKFQTHTKNRKNYRSMRHILRSW